jgi:hypothetical protein
MNDQTLQASIRSAEKVLRTNVSEACEKLLAFVRNVLR